MHAREITWYRRQSIVLISGRNVSIRNIKYFVNINDIFIYFLSSNKFINIDNNCRYKTTAFDNYELVKHRTN